MLELAITLLPLAPFVVERFGRHWRGTVMFVMVFMVFEGAFRKWLLPGYQAQIYLLKDALLVFALVGFLVERRPPGAHEPLLERTRAVVLACMVFCFMQLANPNSPSPLLWAIGFKAYFLYMALLFMVPYLFKSADDLEKKLNIYMVLMVPVALLGLIQFASPPDAFVNIQVAHDVEVEIIASNFGEDNRARTSGTFSYIGGFATFLPAMIALSLSFFLARKGTVRNNLVPLAMLMSCALAMFTTGSRHVVLSSLLIVTVSVLLCMKERLIGSVSVMRAFVGCGLISLSVWYTASDAFEAFVHRTENSDDPIMRLLSPFTELYGAFMVGPVLGGGLARRTIRRFRSCK